MKRRILVSTFWCLAMLLALAGCGGQTPPTSTATDVVASVAPAVTVDVSSVVEASVVARQTASADASATTAAAATAEDPNVSGKDDPPTALPKDSEPTVVTSSANDVQPVDIDHIVLLANGVEISLTSEQFSKSLFNNPLFL